MINSTILTLSAMDVISGDPGGTFRPSDPITQGEFASMVQKYFGLAEGTITDFPDIDGHWACTAITAAEAAGITVGDNNGDFTPNASITRAQAVTMLNKAQGRIASEEDFAGIECPFSDVTTEHWGYAQIMEEAVAHYHG